MTAKRSNSKVRKSRAAAPRKPNLERSKVEERKAKAVAFLSRIGKGNEARRLDEEPLESYAMRKGIRIDENPGRGTAKREALEKKLEAEGRKKGLAGKRLDAYIYGTVDRVLGRPARRRPTAAKKATKSKRKPNGEEQELQQAAALYEDFHGKPAKTVQKLAVPDRAPKNFSKLGDLVHLTILDAEGKERRIKFGERDQVMLAANPTGTQLYMLGGNQDVRALLPGLGVDTTKDLVELGPCVEVEYFTRKGFDQFKPIRYFHRLGEETGDVPVLAFDQINLQLMLVGGAYYVRPEGLRN